MKETGIIMSGNHPRLVLDGIKTMTRRIWGLNEINKEPGKWILVKRNQMIGIPLDTFIFHDKKDRLDDGEPIREFIKCPYGQVGDRLWVRETCKIMDFGDHKGVVQYKTTSNIEDIDTDGSVARLKWTPSLFMPRWASRITLEITELRAERLQEITEADAIAEGIQVIAGHRIAPILIDEKGKPYSGEWRDATACDEFAGLWDSLNAKRGYGWDFDPWVWVIGFDLIEPDPDEGLELRPEIIERLKAKNG